MTTFEDAASYYVGLGWQVLPLAAMSKLPAIKGGHGFKDATDDWPTIEGWIRAYPNCNIGIATGEVSGITVVDIDPRNGGDASIARLAGKGLLFPPGPEARTGNNGRHLIFAYEPSVKASKDRLGPGVDLKANGGYIVAAPSVIAKSENGPGGQYRWTRPPHPRTPLPRLPRWAVEMLVPKKPTLPTFQRQHVTTADSARRSLEGMASRLASAGSGQRNNILNWAAFNAGRLVREGKIGPSEVQSRLLQAALSCGLPVPEAQATINSGLRAAATGEMKP